MNLPLGGYKNCGLRQGTSGGISEGEASPSNGCEGCESFEQVIQRTLAVTRHCAVADLERPPPDEEHPAGKVRQYVLERNGETGG